MHSTPKDAVIQYLQDELKATKAELDRIQAPALLISSGPAVHLHGSGNACDCKPITDEPLVNAFVISFNASLYLRDNWHAIHASNGGPGAIFLLHCSATSTCKEATEVRRRLEKRLESQVKRPPIYNRHTPLANMDLSPHAINFIRDITAHRDELLLKLSESRSQQAAQATLHSDPGSRQLQELLHVAATT